jgi:hypothetical protein
LSPVAPVFPNPCKWAGFVVREDASVQIAGSIRAAAERGQRV